MAELKRTTENVNKLDFKNSQNLENCQNFTVSVYVCNVWGLFVIDQQSLQCFK